MNPLLTLVALVGLILAARVAINLIWLFRNRRPYRPVVLDFIAPIERPSFWAAFDAVAAFTTALWLAFFRFLIVMLGFLFGAMIPFNSVLIWVAQKGPLTGSGYVDVLLDYWLEMGNFVLGYGAVALHFSFRDWWFVSHPLLFVQSMLAAWAVLGCICGESQPRRLEVRNQLPNS